MSRKYSVKYFQPNSAKNVDRIINYFNKLGDVRQSSEFQKIKQYRKTTKKMFNSNREKYNIRNERLQDRLNEFIQSGEFKFDYSKSKGIAIETYEYDTKTGSGVSEYSWESEEILNMSPEELLKFKERVFEVLKEYGAIMYQKAFVDIHYPRWIYRVKRALGVPSNVSMNEFLKILERYVF